MDNKRIFDKLERIEENVGKQEVSLARLTVSVEEHVKRSNMLEDALKPVEKHVAMVEGALKFIGVLGVVASIVKAISLLL